MNGNGKHEYRLKPLGPVACYPWKLLFPRLYTRGYLREAELVDSLCPEEQGPCPNGRLRESVGQSLSVFVTSRVFGFPWPGVQISSDCPPLTVLRLLDILGCIELKSETCEFLKLFYDIICTATCLLRYAHNLE